MLSLSVTLKRLRIRQPGLARDVAAGPRLPAVAGTGRRSEPIPVRRGLRNRGVAVCIACDYDLAAQVALRCPECGEPFDPALLEQVARIEPDEPRGPTGA